MRTNVPHHPHMQPRLVEQKKSCSSSHRTQSCSIKSRSCPADPRGIAPSSSSRVHSRPLQCGRKQRPCFIIDGPKVVHLRDGNIGYIGGTSDHSQSEAVNQGCLLKVVTLKPFRTANMTCLSSSPSGELLWEHSLMKTGAAECSIIRPGHWVIVSWNF